MRGYEIHIGRSDGSERPLLELNDHPDGAVSADGRVAGTYLHGLLTTPCATRYSTVSDAGLRRSHQWSPHERRLRTPGCRGARQPRGRRSHNNGPAGDYCLFTDPPLARVGMSETEARERGIAVRVVKMDSAAVLRTRTTSERAGFLKR